MTPPEDVAGAPYEAIIPRRLYNRSRRAKLNPHAIAVASALASKLGRSARGFTTAPEIARMVGLSPRRVEDHLRTLTRLQFWRAERHGKRPTEYWLNAEQLSLLNRTVASGQGSHNRTVASGQESHNRTPVSGPPPDPLKGLILNNRLTDCVQSGADDGAGAPSSVGQFLRKEHRMSYADSERVAACQSLEWVESRITFIDRNNERRGVKPINARRKWLVAAAEGDYPFPEWYELELARAAAAAVPIAEGSPAIAEADDVVDRERVLEKAHAIRAQLFARKEAAAP